MAADIYILAGGSSGGHLYPGLAVAEHLLRESPAARVIFACSDRAIDREILEPLPHAIVPQPIKPLPRGPAGCWPFLTAWLAARRQSRHMVSDLKPAGVLGLGGFASVAVIRAASVAGVPTALLNPDAVPGRANRHLAGYVDTIFTQFVSTTECFSPRVSTKIRTVGCPVRMALTEAQDQKKRDEAMTHFGLRPDRRTLLVSGGSLGAAAINDAMVALAASQTFGDQAGQWQILHVCGHTKARAAPAPKIETVRIEYCDRMDLALAAADVAVCRGGASTVAELAVTATPAIIVPYPHHRDRQQYLNAQPMVEAGGAVICEETGGVSRDVAALRDVLLPVLGDHARLEAMRRGLAALSRPRAAAHVARWLATAH